MIATAASWGVERRFFLPNEDARPVAAALAQLPRPPEHPVFVGGSGFVLLEALARAARGARATFVDVAPFQVEYFHEVVTAVHAARSTRELRAWFEERVHPRLRAHYQARGEDYPLAAALSAMRELFGLSLFFEQDALERARGVAARVAVRCDEIGRYLERDGPRHDFVYLGNVADYLGPEALARLLAACRRHEAPVYALTTSRCPAPERFLPACAAAGLAVHPGSCSIDAQNRGLGSPTLDRRWNRPGTIHLLVPASPFGGRA